MEDIYTLHGALESGLRGQIEQWVHTFLQGVGHNPFLSYILSLKKRYFFNPVLIRLNLFSRNCGPEENIIYKVKKPGFEVMVSSMMHSFRNDWDMPPLIIEYKNGKFDLSDGNHRFEALTRLGIAHYFIIFWTTDDHDYERLKELIKSESIR